MSFAALSEHSSGQIVAGPGGAGPGRDGTARPGTTGASDKSERSQGRMLQYPYGKFLETLPEFQGGIKRDPPIIHELIDIEYSTDDEVRFIIC